MNKFTQEQVIGLQNDLAQFYGTEQYHRWSILFKNHLLTDGVHFLCEKAQCYWLVDIIGSYHSKCMKDPMLRDMQFWTLTVNPPEKTIESFTVGAVKPKKPKPMATVICERDTGNVAFRQNIPYTDFPLHQIKLWVESTGDGHWVIMLPQER